MMDERVVGCVEGTGFNQADLLEYAARRASPPQVAMLYKAILWRSGAKKSFLEQEWKDKFFKIPIRI